jgi:hypothetical protein
MPRLPIDYSKTVIYKIVCNDLSILECYVGHMTDFTRRKSNHKGHCNNEYGKSYGLRLYKTIRENGGCDNWTMVEVEKYSCKDANEATAKERKWFKRLNSTDIYLDRGICHIPLDQEEFENIIHQKGHNNDYYDYTEYYDYVEQQYSEYRKYQLMTNSIIDYKYNKSFIKKA